MCPRVSLVFRGSSFLSAEQQGPFNGHLSNGGTSLAPGGMRSLHANAHSEVRAAANLRTVVRTVEAVKCNNEHLAATDTF